MKLALEFALGANKPVVIRYPKDLVPPQEYIKSACARPFKLGNSIVVRKAKDSAITIVSYGSVLTEALKAACLLAKEGIAADVINARFAAPVDEAISALLGTGKSIITVEDHYLACGFGSAVLESIAAKAFSDKLADIRVLGAPGRFIGHNYRSLQLMEAGINAEKIAETAKEMLHLMIDTYSPSNIKY